MTAITQPVKSLWTRYRSCGDAEAREQLLEKYLGLVHHIARQLSARVGSAVELDELVSAGVLGLLRALESFDVDRGLAFSTYATPRIHGAMLDELRRCDWVPRSIRSKHRKVARAVEHLEGKLGRQPEAEEVAASLDIPLEKYWRWQEEIESSTLVSYETSNVPKDGATVDLKEIVADSRQPAPMERIAAEEDVAAVRDAIANLPPKQRTVLALYYYEEMTLRQIADILHLTESRISQIRSQAVNDLRTSFVIR